MLRRTMRMVLCGTLVITGACALGADKNASPNEKRLKMTRRSIERARQEMERVRRSSRQLTGAHKAACEAFVRAKGAEIEALQKVAQGYESGDEAVIDAARKDWMAKNKVSQQASLVLTQHRSEEMHREAGGRLEKETRDLLRTVSRYTGKVREAAEKLATVNTDLVAAHKKAADAYAAGNVDAARKAIAEQTALKERIRKARDVMTFRRIQETYTSERKVAGWKRNTPEGAVADLENLLTVRKDAAEAYGRLADVAGGAEKERIDEAHDDAITARDRFHLGQTRWNFRREEIARLENAKKNGLDELIAKVEELRKIHEQIFDSRKRQCDAEAKLRKLDRRRARVRREFDRDFNAAIEAAQQPPQKD